MRRKSAREAYAFEREMERDAFLYEAIEGMEDMLTSDIQQALDELDDLLDEKQKKRFFIFTWKAALVGLAVVVIIALITMLSSGKSSDSSVDQDNNYEPRAENASFNTMNELKNKALKEDTSRSIAEEEKVVEQAKEFKVAEPKSNIQKDAPVKEATEQKEKTQKPSTVKSDSERVATTPKSTRNATSTDQQKKTIIEEEKSASTEPAIEENSSTENETKLPKASPSVGMASYQAYLKSNLQRSTGMPNGSVVVSFEFDKDGTPKKVGVAKSLCTACDAEAIRLIENGPKWNVEDRKQRVIISVNF